MQILHTILLDNFSETSLTTSGFNMIISLIFIFYTYTSKACKRCYHLWSYAKRKIFILIHSNFNLSLFIVHANSSSHHEQLLRSLWIWSLSMWCSTWHFGWPCINTWWVPLSKQMAKNPLLSICPWCLGFLGKGHCKVIPEHVKNLIHEIFPDPNGNYMDHKDYWENTNHYQFHSAERGVWMNDT